MVPASDHGREPCMCSPWRHGEISYFGSICCNISAFSPGFQSPGERVPSSVPDCPGPTGFDDSVHGAKSPGREPKRATRHHLRHQSQEAGPTGRARPPGFERRHRERLGISRGLAIGYRVIRSGQRAPCGGQLLAPAAVGEKAEVTDAHPTHPVLGGGTGRGRSPTPGSFDGCAPRSHAGAWPEPSGRVVSSSSYLHGWQTHTGPWEVWTTFNSTRMVGNRQLPRSGSVQQSITLNDCRMSRGI
jgi:hypothetical protein